jgi:regulator of nucleoside diphosphate kinase
MMDRVELFVSAPDAEAVALMLAAHRRQNPFEADASDELADLLMDGRLAPADEVPSDSIGLKTTVTYEEQPSRLRRTVTLVLPPEASIASRAISVLSPIGLALFGRRRGAVASVAAPHGKTLTIRIIDVTRVEHRLANAA